MNPNPPASKRKVMVVLLGEIHRDPVAPAIHRHLLEQSAQHLLKVVLCEEDHAKQTAKTRHDNMGTIIQSNEALIKNLGLTSLLRHDLSIPYFPLSAYDLIKKTVYTAWGGKYLPAAIEQALNQFHRQASFPESLKLSQALLEFKVPYYGVDNHVLSIMDSSDYVQKENSRIQGMQSGIFSAIDKEKDAQVFYIKLGINHAHRLAAHLYLQSLKRDDLELSIVAYRLYSDYVADGISAHEEVLRVTAHCDNEAVRSAYQKVPCPLIKCALTKDRSPVLAEALEKQFAEIVERHAPRIRVTLPNVTEANLAEKKALVEKLGGSGWEHNADENTATVTLPTRSLKRESRELLGIVGKKLTFLKTAAPAALLKDNPRITVIEDEVTHLQTSYLVYYPNTPRSCAHVYEVMAREVEERKQAAKLSGKQ